jgi:4-aminobutyrate aminotransferase-like enzyme
MSDPAIHFEREPAANAVRDLIARHEPRSLRTFTPTQAVIERSSGLFHFTADGRKLADFTSGVLVSNLGHHPLDWLERFAWWLGGDPLKAPEASASNGAGAAPANPTLSDGPVAQPGFALLPPWTAYNAISTLEAEAVKRLLANMRGCPGGGRMDRVMWAASGSEAIQKALWACLKRSGDSAAILATRHGFHGKKGLSEAVTGDETSLNRDPRVHFLRFPKEHCRDLRTRFEPFDFAPFERELDDLRRRVGTIACLITEPYLGGGGSWHPPVGYLQGLTRWCQRHDIPFILDEVQSNFGRTGRMYAYEAYGIEPDITVLGKGMGNGVPVNAAVGRDDLLSAMSYGEASDTWSAHPLGCAATLATLDIFETKPILEQARRVADRLEAGLARLRTLPAISACRGEGVVWGIEFAPIGARSAVEVAREFVRLAYLGDDQGRAVHLLGPLSGNVVRLAPPITMSESETDEWMAALHGFASRLA